MKVFVGGSRRVTRLNPDIRERLDRMVQNGLHVLVGDANGADKSVQQYLHSRGYDRVDVFCIEGACRNNIGRWRTRVVSPPTSRRDFSFYSAKDEEMAREASVGLMLWDGESRGTMANIERLTQQGKTVVVYLAPEKSFVTLRNQSDLASFLGDRPRTGRGGKRKATRQQSNLFR